MDLSTKRVRRYRIKNPWTRYREYAKRRCEDVKHRSYRYYGGKGIRCLLTTDDVKLLWYRDKAYNLLKPSLERIDSNLDYSLENCMFIEFKLNSARCDYVEIGDSIPVFSD